MALDSSNLGSSKVEEIAAKNIRNQIVKYVSPVLKTVRDPPDNAEEYKAMYGSLGPYLYQGVVRDRQQSGNKSGATAPVTATPAVTQQQQQASVRMSSPGVMIPGTPGTPIAVQQQNRVFIASPQPQGIRVAQPQQLQQQQPGIMLPGQMMTLQQQQQQQLQRQFSQPGQNPFQ